MAATLFLGGEDRSSAKRRQQDAYRQDLELQMKENKAAKVRERLQDMNVNASGWLDPEKSPERFKPLGGVNWIEQRGTRDTKVKPYHTLFLYGRVPDNNEEVIIDRTPRVVVDQPSAHVIHKYGSIDSTAGLNYQPVTYASTALGVPNSSIDQAYNFYATRDLEQGGGGGHSIVQPLTMPYVDNRPIIVTGQSGGSGYNGPRFNPFEKDDASLRDLRSLIGLSQLETDRQRARLERENEDFQRKLRLELESERRKMQDQEAEARRRMEELRREAEERRKEAERQRLEAERIKKEAETKLKTSPKKSRPQSNTMLYYDMNDYRSQLIDERKKIEDLLKAGNKIDKEVWDIKVYQRPRLPPTPKSADRANRNNVEDFDKLKHRNFETRQQFRSIFPDVPWTNRRLEMQQDALLRQQESTLQTIAKYRPVRERLEIPPRRAISRPSWMDRNPTPFPHVLRHRDKLYTAKSWDGDLDRIERRNKERERIIDNKTNQNEEEVLDELRLRHDRPASAETLTDDTWLRPSSTTVV